MMKHSGFPSFLKEKKHCRAYTTSDFIVVLLVAVVFGCAGMAIREDNLKSKKASKPDYQAELIGVTDGCKRYRFWDDSRYHYYVVCQDKEVTTSTDHEEGTRAQRSTYAEEIKTTHTKVKK